MNTGDIIDNHYELKHQLGRGSFGEVWLATDTYVNQDVALKFYVAMDDNGRNEFVEEYRKVCHFRHNNLLTPSHYAEWNGQPYLELEYCPVSAVSLAGKISEPLLWQFIADVAAGLAYMHGSNPTIVHQDIKPANILQKTDGHFAITDFGISVSLRSTMLRQSGHNVLGSIGGSIPYMGPELFSAKPLPVMASDIWALGVTIYEMATGDLPFMGQGGVMLKNGAELPILDDFSPELNQLMQNCLALNTWDRPTAETLTKQAAAHCNGASPFKTQESAANHKTEHSDSATQKMPIQPVEEQPQQPATPHNNQSIKSGKVFRYVVGVIVLIFFLTFIAGVGKMGNYNKALREFESNLNKGDITSLNLANAILNNMKLMENAPFSYMITPRSDELQHKLDEKRKMASQQSNNESVSIEILNPKLELSSYDVMESSGKGGHIDIAVTTDAGNYTATCNQNWCKITNQKDSSFRIEVEANTTDSTREAIVTVTAGPQPKSITVTQKPKPKEIPATNSNSTKPTTSSSETKKKPIKPAQSQSGNSSSSTNSKSSSASNSSSLENNTTKNGSTYNVYVSGYGNIEMVYVEGGTFTMGATAEQGSDAGEDAKPTHSVTLSNYYIGKYEVTQGLWKTIMGKNPSDDALGNNYPVENVSWNDCQEFIRKLNQKTGRRFRLPTEAEWEFAARGGNQSKGYKYSGSNSSSSVAWESGNSGYHTQPVGKKQANELGIYDMSGNVWEWCQDRYGIYNYYSQTNPTGSSSGSYRILRGGSRKSSFSFLRVCKRNFDNPDYFNDDYGLRLAMDK
ncbi:MAG: SUMF1/EgtB/PvdO family nonheme iron enzyme [Salinivirgaceae bacterium]|nr:SUMF1/EgtB/PvdO family nonheme iron enzyme [Salinivirgaceae bacterium]